MRAILSLLLTLVAFGAVEAKRPTAPVHRVMSCNIRITGLPADEVEGRRWDDRKAYMIDVIRHQKPDVVMMQEVIYDSYAYCREQLKEYVCFGFEGPEMVGGTLRKVSPLALLLMI